MNDKIPESIKHHIVVIVRDGRWEAHGDPTNPLSAMLYQQLVEIGGVNETVPDGVHFFNGEKVEGATWSFTLDETPNM